MEKQFSGKTVLLTGTAGDIGRRLAERLLDLNAVVSLIVGPLNGDHDWMRIVAFIFHFVF